MSTKETKAKVRKIAGRVERGVQVAAAGKTNGAGALGRQRDALQDRLRNIGRKLQDSAEALTDEASRLARLRPLAVFGIAFVAGVIVARALRR